MSTLRRNSSRVFLAATCLSVAILAIACGTQGGAETTTTPSSPVESPTGGSPTATSQPTTAPTQAPGKTGGTVNVAIRELDQGSWLNRNGHPSELAQHLSVSEGFFMPAAEGSGDVGALVDSWELAPDLSKVTLHLREGVQFHDGWGEVTAEDVVWSVNDANAAVTPESIHGQAGDLAVMFKAWEVVDEYTVDAPFSQFDSTWQRGLLNSWFQSVDVLSKKVHDDLGADQANETRVSTGPFKVIEWREHDRIVAEAVEDHYRATAKVDGFTVREMPEESSRIAALKTGEIDITDIQVLRNIPDLENSGMFINQGTQERQQPAILFAGNLWETEHALTGEPLDRPGLDKSKPWIGDPADPESMERAKKVRWALALAVDREAIKDTILGGLGAVNSLPWFSELNPELWEERWKVEYDPDAAKAMLDEAGYPDGFTLQMFDSQIYGPAEVSKAVAAMWRDVLNVDATVDLSAYTSFRPAIVERTANIPWVSGCDFGRNIPADWPRGASGSSLTRGGFSCGFEMPEYADAFLRSSVEPDAEKRIEINKELGDFAYEWMPAVGTVEVPGIWVQNPERVAEWRLIRGFKNNINSLETVALK